MDDFRPEAAPDVPREELQALLRDVSTLAAELGERNLRDEACYRRLQQAGDFIEDSLRAAGLRTERQGYRVQGRLVHNIEAELSGGLRHDEVVIIGAHYDTAHGSPGANDNATGVAVLLALARALLQEQRPRTVRLVAFATEEPPFTRTSEMGSLVYARRCRARQERVVGMLSLETLGSFYEQRRGPEAPFPLNIISPWRGDFIAVVGNPASRKLVDRIIQSFRPGSGLRCRRAILPGLLPGVRSSDHWSFWKQGYPAAMVTDTAPLRYRHYHRRTDTLDKLDLPRLAAVARGLLPVVDTLARG
jgi:hypothetical protein